MVARALHLDANVIFFDETTASLGSEEAQKIFAVMSKIKSEGKAVIFVTHRLDEVVQVAYRVTVFKDGKIVESGLVSEFTLDSMVTKMVGREISKVFPEKSRAPGDVILGLDLITTARINQISLTVCQGEVVALAGLVGSGRTEVLESIFGMEKIISGTMSLGGSVFSPTNPIAAIRAGIGLVPEDRRSQGIIAMRSVEENLSISWAGRTVKRGWRGKVLGLTAEFIDRMAIRTPSPRQLIGLLSGGNQQKVIVARWLATNPKVLLLDEPTRGIDVGAKAEMYRLIDSLAREGLGILLVSSEMTEILGLADRILVMRGGQIAGELGGDATEEEVLKLAMIGEKTA
jgi:L-arabinose transport system ATP-binding protein